MQFQVGIRCEFFKLDLIQNSRLSAIITFIMRDIWQTVRDS